MGSKMIKVLLLGCKGQVGIELKKMLSQANFELLSTSRSKEEKTILLDLTQSDSISNVITEVKPNIIINAAAYTAVDKAEDEQELAELVNSKAVEQIAHMARDCQAHLIHYSTDYVYDGLGCHPRKESEQPSPVNYYGHSKFKGEEAIVSSGCKHTIIRTSWVFSSHGKNFVKTMLKVAQNHKSLSVVNDQIGSPTSARQIAEVTHELIKQLVKDPKNESLQGIFHLSGSGYVSWADFARKIFDIGSQYDSSFKDVKINDIATKDYPTTAKRPLNSRLDCSKLKQALGVKILPWEDSLAHVLGEIMEGQS